MWTWCSCLPQAGGDSSPSPNCLKWSFGNPAYCYSFFGPLLLRFLPQVPSSYFCFQILTLLLCFYQVLHWCSPTLFTSALFGSPFFTLVKGHHLQGCSIFTSPFSDPAARRQGQRRGNAEGQRGWQASWEIQSPPLLLHLRLAFGPPQNLSVLTAERVFFHGRCVIQHLLMLLVDIYCVIGRNQCFAF